MNIGKLERLFICCICFVLLSCDLVSQNKIPYLIEGEMTLEDSSRYEAAGFNFTFINQADKPVKDFTMVFYMFDEDGNPVGTGRNNVVLRVVSDISENSSLSGCISLDDFLNEIPSEEYEIDYLYVSQINYEDDSTWSDPFGLCVF